MAWQEIGRGVRIRLRVVASQEGEDRADVKIERRELKKTSILG